MSDPYDPPSRGVMMYGAPPDPKAPGPRPEPVITPGTNWDLAQRHQPRRLRVSAHVEEDGTVRLKVLADGRLVVETSGRQTVTVETDIRLQVEELRGEIQTAVERIDRGDEDVARTGLRRALRALDSTGGDDRG